MLDVFVAGFCVVAVRPGSVAGVETDYGLYACGIVFLPTAAITTRVIYRAGNVELNGHPA